MSFVKVLIICVLITFALLIAGTISIVSNGSGCWYAVKEVRCTVDTSHVKYIQERYMNVSRCSKCGGKTTNRIVAERMVGFRREHKD
jgi:hypothetical protein